MACFVNAAGMHLDPVVIHKGGKVSPGWRVDKPEGVMLSYSSNGWINKRIFYEYGQQFIRFLKDRNLLGPTQRHVLLMDSHSTHEFNYQFMKLMVDNRVEVLSFPAHMTHCLQVSLHSYYQILIVISVIFLGGQVTVTIKI